MKLLLGAGTDTKVSMKRQIRIRVFETNSSSTHAISVSGNELNVPKSLHFGCNEFGWECETYKTAESRASYLWTYIFNRFSSYEHAKKEDGSSDYQLPRIYTFDQKFLDWKEHLEKICKKVGVENVTFQESVHQRGWYDDAGYIDHSYELDEFVDDLWNDDHLLEQYLFCDDSGIETGNDNDDYDVTFAAKNEIYNYYKLN